MRPAPVGMVVGQISADPLSGGAGWVGAGLLGCVLAWLFAKHLPAKDQQIADMLVLHRQQMRELAIDYKATLIEVSTRVAELDRERRNDVREMLAQIIAHNEHDAAQIVKSVTDLAILIAELRHALEDERRERNP